MNRLPSLLISSLFFSTFLTGCFGKKPKETIYELVGSKEVRVEALTNVLLRENESLPSPLLNGYLLEIKIGDGRMGPSDFRTFLSFEVAPDELEKWIQLLGGPIERPLKAELPSLDRFWWRSAESLQGLTFYPGKALSGRYNSWAAIDPDDGRIYVYSFTL